jgi:hypothetical protein
MPPSVAKPSPVPSEEKRAALAHVIAGRTFQKSDLLIRFLKYICEKEIAGQAQDISEYTVATEALGRPSDFSPEADSSVRSRAHALRRKLEDCYREEFPDAPVRIVLPKGSYVPEFIALAPKAEPAPLPAAPPVLPATPPPHAAPKPTGSSRDRSWAFAAGAGTMLLISSVVFRANFGSVLAMAVTMAAVLAAGLLAYRRYCVPLRPIPPEVLRQAWDPLLTATSDVLVVVAVPKQFWAREFASGERPRNEKWYPNLPQDAELNRWFYESEEPRAGTSILLHANVGSPLWGDMAAALGVVRTLSAYRINHQVLPERVLKPYALRGRNVLLFGNPEYSLSIRRLLKDRPFTVEYDATSHWEAVVNRDPRPGEPDAFRRSRSEDCLGLLTVITEEHDESKPTRIVIFSGLTSAGAQAAAEFFSSSAALTDLAGRFQADGLAGWPKSYQVVVEASTDLNLPINFRYRAHRMLSS